MQNPIIFRIFALMEKYKWRHVDKELPVTTEEVLLAYYWESTGMWIYELAYLSEDKGHWESENYRYKLELYTHWKYIESPDLLP